MMIIFSLNIFNIKLSISASQSVGERIYFRWCSKTWMFSLSWQIIKCLKMTMIDEHRSIPVIKPFPSNIPFLILLLSKCGLYLQKIDYFMKFQFLSVSANKKIIKWIPLIFFQCNTDHNVASNYENIEGCQHCCDEIFIHCCNSWVFVKVKSFDDYNFCYCQGIVEEDSSNTK